MSLYLVSAPPEAADVSMPATNLAEIRADTPAVVLKLDQNVMHHGGLGVIRSLGRLGVRVYGVHENRLAPAASSRFLSGRYFWHPDAADPGPVTAGLLRLADHVGSPAVLIATDDAGAIFLAENGDQLRSAFLFPRPPAELPRRVADKYSLYQLCREHGIPAPRTVLAASDRDVREFVASLGFPLIAKLTTPWHGHNAVRSTTIVPDEVALTGIRRACAHAGVSLLLQEFIPAGPQCDWFFHAYCDANSACRPAFTGVKERSYPARAGLTTVGRSVPNDRLRDRLSALLAAVGYRGIVDLDLRRDPRDGQYKLLDFNPRLGAQFRLFLDTAGTDVVRAQYLDLTGQAVPDCEQVSGRKFVVENYDPLAAISHWRRGELGARTWAASLRGTDETAWFARDDLRPFGLMCARMAVRAVSRPVSGKGLAAPAGVGRYSVGRYSAGRRAARSPRPHALAGLGRRMGADIQRNASDQPQVRSGRRRADD
jgi:D-aspartate ligase